MMRVPMSTTRSSFCCTDETAVFSNFERRFEMTKEERSAHADDVRNEYVPRLRTYDADVEKEIRSLPLQDVVTIYCESVYAFGKGWFAGVSWDAMRNGDDRAVRFYDAIGHVREILIERIRTADALWIIRDKTTESLLADKNGLVWIFTEREVAEDYAENNASQYGTDFAVAEISGNEIVRFFEQTAHKNEANGVRINTGEYTHTRLTTEQIIEKPDSDAY